MPKSDFHFRPLVKADAAALFSLVSGNKKRLEKYFPVTLKSVHSLVSSKAYIKESLKKAKNRDGYYFLIDYLPEKRPVSLMILKEIDWRIPKGELAYFVDGDFEGQGLATWGVKQLTAFAFTKLEFRKLFLIADEANHGSCRVAEKNGYKQEGLLRDDYRTGVGDLINSRYYGLLREEWRNR